MDSWCILTSTYTHITTPQSRYRSFPSLLQNVPPCIFSDTSFLTPRSNYWLVFYHYGLIPEFHINVCILLFLSLWALHNVSRLIILLHVSTVTPLYCCVYINHMYVYTTTFYPFTFWWSFELSQFRDTRDICVQVFLWTCFHFSWVNTHQEFLGCMVRVCVIS